MKKWHIITGISVISVAVIVLSFIFVYRFFVLPKVIEPVVEDISSYLKDDAVLEALYDEAVNLHDAGIMDDKTYTSFLRSYSEHFRDDEAYANRILAKKAQNSNPINEENALKTKYASHKVGIEIIKVNDGESDGNASTTYSDERNSERIKAEDYVEAEQIIEDSKKTEEPTDEPDIVQSAYQKLKANMTAAEFSTFTKIMAKLDFNTLRSLMTDKDELKAYLHARLTDDEYKEIVNLGYKYVHVFIEDED